MNHAEDGKPWEPAGLNRVGCKKREDGFPRLPAMNWKTPERQRPSTAAFSIASPFT